MDFARAKESAAEEMIFVLVPVTFPLSSDSSMLFRTCMSIVYPRNNINHTPHSITSRSSAF